tara:strand:- start:145 stop:324 length:180 start_codon:yes stop_codon:yes gene_type:complete
MIKKIVNWIKSLFGTSGPDYRFIKAEGEPVEEESTVQHCASHLRFRKNCPDCLRAVGVM